MTSQEYLVSQCGKTDIGLNQRVLKLQFPSATASQWSVQMGIVVHEYGACPGLPSLDIGSKEDHLQMSTSLSGSTTAGGGVRINQWGF